MVGVVGRIIEYKILFGLYPLIATEQEIERETGRNRAEIGRISQELVKDGRIYQGRTINGKYYRLTQKVNSQEKQLIMKGFQNAIKEHLDKMAAQDEVFAAKYAAKCEAEPESIKKCCSYIIDQVQKNYKHGNSAVLTNDEVFGMAMHYYDENIAPPKVASNCTVIMSKEQLTPEDEEAIRREARAAAEQKIRDEETARIQREKAEAERKRIAAEEAAAKKKEAAERKKKEEAERKCKEWEEADLLFSFED
jgi:hypothetical protein